MNTMGKILVMLNLLFALATGGFLVIDYTARTPWREEAEHRKRLYDVAEANRAAAIKMERAAIAEAKKLRADLDSYLINQNSDKTRLDIQIGNLKQEVKKAQDQAAEAVQNSERAQAEAKRRQDEVKILSETVRKREEEITKAQGEATRYRNEALTQADIARTATQRSLNLFKQLQEKERQLVDAQQKGPAGTMPASVRDPNYNNPPPAFVKGKIEKLLASAPGLVQVNVGSDVGVNKDNTLEVYRLRPQAAYLGRLRITDVYHHRAIGHLIPAPGRTLPALREGDEVASEIR